MTITPETVKELAGLAKIGLTEAGTEDLALELGGIATFAGKLAELDTENIQPTNHGVLARNALREDAVIPSTPREVILANAPGHDETCFLTPKVLD